MLSVNGVYILADVIIVDPTRVELVSQVTFSCGVVAIVVVWAKDGLYCNLFLMDMFFLVVIKVFECLH